MKTYKINDVTLSETELRKLIKENPELKEENQGRWKPEHNERYWFVISAGISCSDYWTNHAMDSFKWKSKNCFKTEEEADKALERIEAINIVTLAIEEANEGWVPDWSNSYIKYTIIYDHVKKIVTGFDIKLQAPLILPYIKTEEIADQIIKDYEKELKLIFEVDLS